MSTTDHLDSTMMVIGETPQLFLDNAIIEACQEITKTFHLSRTKTRQTR